MEELIADLSGDPALVAVGRLVTGDFFLSSLAGDVALNVNDITRIRIPHTKDERLTYRCRFERHRWRLVAESWTGCVISDVILVEAWLFIAWSRLTGFKIHGAIADLTLLLRHRRALTAHTISTLSFKINI